MTYVLDYCKEDYFGRVKYITYIMKKENVKLILLLNYIKLTSILKICSQKNFANLKNRTTFALEQN